MATQDFAVKRSVLRVFGLSLVTSGLYFYYWFYVTRQKLSEQLGTKDNAGLQVVGLIVPILNAFILYWLYRDTNKVREKAKLDTFPAVWFVVVPFIVGALAILGLIIGIIVAAVGVASLDSSNSSAGGVGVGIAALMIIGSIGLVLLALILQIVFAGIAISKYNEYWDVVSKGKATEAKFGQGEIIIIVIGLVLMIVNAITGALTPDTSYDYHDNNSPYHYNTSDSAY